VLESSKVPMLKVDDGHAVQIHLKDKSIYAYILQRFVYSERLQLRDITDDLLAKDIIKRSISPYCARVISVQKRNGKLRLCVDLQSRVLKNRDIRF